MDDNKHFQIPIPVDTRAELYGQSTYGHMVPSDLEFKKFQQLENKSVPEPKPKKFFGVECICKSEETNEPKKTECFKECVKWLDEIRDDCALTTKCFICNMALLFVLSFILAICAVTIHENEPIISECKQLRGQEQEDCLNNINRLVVNYSFAVSILILCIELMMTQAVVACNRKSTQLQPKSVYQCINGCPNQALWKKITPWICLIVFHFCIMAFVYSVKHNQHCRDNCDDSFGGQYLAGLILSGMGFIICLGCLWISIQL